MVGTAPEKMDALGPAKVEQGPDVADADVRILGGVPGAMLARIRDGSATPYSYLLWLRFSIVNIAALAIVGVAFFQGWIDMVLQADNTGLCLVIFGAFAVGLALSAQKTWETSRELNCAREFDPPRWSRTARYLEAISGRNADSRSMVASALKLKLATRIAIVRHIGNSLVVLGLIGTVIGFIIALSGVDPETVGDVKAVGPMVSTLIQGMSVALYTTLVGAVLNIWLMINYQLLASGTANLIASIVESGESHAGA
jgi:biopolymer transport protein ExbB/TolQ